jgi:glucose-1-phosphate thymidylyltransferase
MKAIILAGGTGSRLNPVTFVLNKNLLPVYDKPAIFYSIELIKKAGIKDICIVAEYKYIEDFKTMLANGSDFGVNIHYESDTYLKKGPASALRFAKNFVKNENVLIVFADGIYDTDISDAIDNFREGALVFLYEVDDPHHYGVYEMGLDGEVLSIEEKPKYPKSNFVTTGMAIYDSMLFYYLDVIDPGLGGEYYTTEIDRCYLQNGNLKAQKLKGFWQDMGTFDGLLKASNYWKGKDKNSMNNKKVQSRTKLYLQ